MADGQPLIRLVQIVNDLRRGYSNCQPLRNKIEHSMLHGVVRHPDRAVLRDAEVTAQHCKVCVLQFMRIIDRIQINRGNPKARHDGTSNFGHILFGHCPEMRIGLRQRFDENRFATHELQHIRKAS